MIYPATLWTKMTLLTLDTTYNNNNGDSDVECSICLKRLSNDKYGENGFISALGHTKHTQETNAFKFCVLHFWMVNIYLCYSSSDKSN